MKTQSKSGRPSVLRRPIQHLYPLEVDCQGSNPPSEVDLPDSLDTTLPDVTTEMPARSQPRRAAAVEARDRILGCLAD